MYARCPQQKCHMTFNPGSVVTWLSCPTLLSHSFKVLWSMSWLSSTGSSVFTIKTCSLFSPTTQCTSLNVLADKVNTPTPLCIIDYMIPIYICQHADIYQSLKLNMNLCCFTSVSEWACFTLNLKFMLNSSAFSIYTALVIGEVVRQEIYIYRYMVFILRTDFFFSATCKLSKPELVL